MDGRHGWKWKRYLEIGSFLTVVLLIIYLFSPAPGVQKVMVSIPHGVGSLRIAEILSDKGIIKGQFLFVLVSRLLNWEKDLKAGVYEFTSPSLIGVLSKIRNGRVKLFKVTLPEGLPKWEVAEILETKLILDKDEFLSLVGDPGSFQEQVSFSLPEDSLEGYLYPDTYYFCWDEDPQRIIRKFLSRFQEEILPLYQKSGLSADYSPQEIVTLASIVEKEARFSSEKAIVAAVFYNRLKRGMKLGACPTVKYALGSFSKKLGKDDLTNTISPYNTYLNYGLPPGSICSPGKESIAAVLNPAEVDYLYFVAKGDGTHQFSSTYRQHLRAVEKYQRG